MADLTPAEQSPGPVAGPGQAMQSLPQPVAGGKGLAPQRATKIMELQSGIAWRSKWMPAKFRNARFHVESAVRESGRRIVSHEFPKRDVPYAEDMGRRAARVHGARLYHRLPEGRCGRR